jgi:hypothetical protein
MRTARGVGDRRRGVGGGVALQVRPGEHEPLDDLVVDLSGLTAAYAAEAPVPTGQDTPVPPIPQ